MGIIREGAQLGDKELIIEHGRMAPQAGGSVVISYGDSQVLCTACDGGEKPHLPFFPLLCDYVENFWAAGKIPGGFFKREGKPSTKATLTSRLIDRPHRPLFPEGYRRDTQLVAWVISADQINDTDVLAITGCSAALMISEMPFNGPVAGVRVGMVDGEFIANPTFAQREESDMDIVLAVTDKAIVMVEGSANEVPEAVMVKAMEFGQESVQGVLELQKQLAKAVGKPKLNVEPVTVDAAILKAVEKESKKELDKALQIAEKLPRYARMDELKAATVEALVEAYPEQEGDIKDAFDSLKKSLMRKRVIKTKTRIDGRDPETVRDIRVEVGLLPMAHGSALFTRGETQALVSCTLGTEYDSKVVDGLEDDFKKRFYLHYNFPGFSVGETKPFRSVSRRELGHGELAERALTASLPDLEEEFPYTVRIVSDTLASNGSSSMAAVCGGSLAMMDAGVPFKKATAGIAMGMIKEGKDIVVLSDILGDEDHMGDMDFKVTGTVDGITAFQLDTKIEGITFKTMEKALLQAKEGRDHILGVMNEAIAEPRKELADTAPRITFIKIDPSSIGAVIGSGGKTIRGIQEATGARVNIEDDGTVKIAANNAESAQQVIEIIEGLTATPEEGKIYLGTVKNITDFGAFIEILPGTEGLCHISELAEGRVENVGDVLSQGDEVCVKCLSVDMKRGRIKLSLKAAAAEQEDADA
ncbi:polyribonucleotide nucleotidyltransferase [Bradymonas sediminis]|uniref:Polyribonucleotide nucleotidyltransferase n=1 Tax=Bradymonas sediminis TaxID=1548548 RepID=A0A2Z4FJD2_9DELT|nr:polyribonucleotide nucleotidyltransferase [Bradymonas sediminis]AWV89039.1 polyribonucleotide nucleotidyltransferase [Bradymonas sediminis]TDP64502.1 polyribonucleotide nucleotidyltransferase [Bradymonas sediminis]